MHAPEMVADARTDRVRIARLTRQSAVAELGHRSYRVIAVVAAVSTTTAVMSTLARVRADGTRDQADAWLAHRQTLLGVLANRRLIGRSGR